MAESRRVGIVVRMSRGAVPVIVAVTIAPAACNSFDDPGSDGFRNGPGFLPIFDASAIGGRGGGGIGATGGAILFGDTGGSGGSSSGSGECYFVEIPLEGVPADPGQICAVSADPVVSTSAARVTLTWSGVAPFDSAAGFVAIDSDVEPAIIGTPGLEVVDATLPLLFETQFQDLQKTNGGYSFVARWPSVIPVSSDVVARMTVRTTFAIACAGDAGVDSGAGVAVDGGTKAAADSGAKSSADSGTDAGADAASNSGPTRIVHAATEIHLCISEEYGVYWASSGDQCMACRVVAEMAPSPIVPDKTSDGLPLARALRLRIVVLARVSNTVVLLAENDGGTGLDYEWHPSAGRLERIAQDVVAWSVEQGMESPFIQAAVIGTDAAAVATFAWNDPA